MRLTCIGPACPVTTVCVGVIIWLVRFTVVPLMTLGSTAPRNEYVRPSTRTRTVQPRIWHRNKLRIQDQLNIRGWQTWVSLKVVGHEWPMTALYEWLFQEVRYGERTARGITGGIIVCWAFTLRDAMSVSNIRIRIMVSRGSDAMEEIELLRRSTTSAPGKQNDRWVTSRRAKKNGDSCGDKDNDENSSLWGAAKVTRPWY